MLRKHALPCAVVERQWSSNVPTQINSWSPIIIKVDEARLDVGAASDVQVPLITYSNLANQPGTVSKYGRNGLLDFRLARNQTMSGHLRVLEVHTRIIRKGSLLRETFPVDRLRIDTAKENIETSESLHSVSAAPWWPRASSQDVCECRSQRSRTSNLVARATTKPADRL